MSVRFETGQIVATPGALEALRQAGQRPLEFLDRHVRGDWGDLDEEDMRLNDEAVEDGSRVLSSYTLATGDRLWIISEAKGDDGRRACSTLLIPDDY
ncbi:MAG: hypothetical protein BGO49_20360 [Planctomycetales bacterium 71-10]|nr:MAG: hypothetical protein BGO49_20360 [Planctomycetales bacterium 71-10]